MGCRCARLSPFFEQISPPRCLSYTITGKDNVVPLYNVTLSKLTFLSTGACDRNIPFPIPLENQEIHFGWWSPDGILCEPPSISRGPNSAHSLGPNSAHDFQS